MAAGQDGAGVCLGDRVGVLAAEIIIEGRVIAEQWAMLDRVVKILELRAGARGR